MLLKKQSKSYPLWNHRKFCITEAYNLEKKSQSTDYLYIKDLKLCEMMLKKDDRNFHAWNYRNWLTTLDSNLV